MADIGVELNSGGIIIDTIGRLKYLTKIDELKDIAETLDLMCEIFIEEKEKSVISVNKEAFSKGAENAKKYWRQKLPCPAQGIFRN